MSSSTVLHIFSHLGGPSVPEPAPGKTETQSVCHHWMVSLSYSIRSSLWAADTDGISRCLGCCSTLQLQTDLFFQRYCLTLYRNQCNLPLLTMLRTEATALQHSAKQVRTMTLNLVICGCWSCAQKLQHHLTGVTATFKAKLAELTVDTIVAEKLKAEVS